MPAALQLAPDTARLSAAAALQKVLPKLVALSLDAKQAHWNVTGEAFHTVHTLTDQIAADARIWADRLAERAVALGFAVDARAVTVASAAAAFPAGRLADRDAILELLGAVDRAAATARSALAAIDGGDPVSHDVVVDVLEGLEKYRWMLEAQAC